MGKYDDIINLPHHVSDFHKPMAMKNRAAQFAPFAALNGHEEAIEETIRQTEALKELSEDEIKLLSLKLKYAIENNALVNITYFVPDQRKMGGSYRNISGIIKKWIEIENLLIMKEGNIVPVNLISEIDVLGSKIEW